MRLTRLGDKKSPFYRIVLQIQELLEMQNILT